MSGVAKVTGTAMTDRQTTIRSLRGQAPIGEAEIRGDKPEIQPAQPWEPCVFRPLPKAENAPLVRQNCAGGDTNHDRLRQLIASVLQEKRKAKWTAADYNNLGCAYVWLYGKDGKKQAGKCFNNARDLAERDNQASEETRKVICANIRLLGSIP